jgi:PTS system nitrogen regulatory IIA component
MASGISSFLSPCEVLLDIRAASKVSLLHELSERSADLTGLSPEYIFAELSKRENLGSTGMGDGVAIPHATYAGLKEPFGIAARIKPAIDFESIDSKPVDLVFLLLTPALSEKTHLNALAAVSRKLRNGDVTARLRAAVDRETFYGALTAGAHCV